MSILLTGGAGYIGSHTAVELLNAGYDVVIADNYGNSKPEVLNRIKELTGKEFKFYEMDVADKTALTNLFSNESIEAVIHFAGLKAVGESVEKPLWYYRNNLDTTLSLMEVMKEYDCKNFIFSSSATVYGTPESVPLTEDTKVGICTNPYGWTKWMTEQILKDICKSDSELSVVLLRYFNPVGAHESGRIGEDPQGIPNNLFPYIAQVAVGKRDHLNVFGNDYPTPDGTGIRDYIHVVDLAKGHVAALTYADNNKGIEVFNLGTGTGYSVLDMVHAFESANGIKIPYKIAPRRAGDVAECYADPKKAREVLGWTAEKTLEDMCRDTWRWQSNNPNGYDK
ncbi:MAG: UDP-glucose 4-epimerase GalE [Lachnospiraceae bacterium]|nr:UDP-glucose 4-epimerase GalE [Lachnospiraceae bacterium]